VLTVSTIQKQNEEKAKTMPSYKADRRLYLNAAKDAVVEEGSADAAYLLVSEGGVLSIEEAEKYGLLGAAAPVVVEPAPEVESSTSHSHALVESGSDHSHPFSVKV
jgi:hypothetical protein